MITAEFDRETSTLRVEASGEVSHSDYRDVFIPAVESALDISGKINLLYVFSATYEGFTTRAALDDNRLGLTHLTDFRRIAVVSDQSWLRNAVSAFSVFMPAEISTYSLSDLETAEKWVSHT